MSTASLSTAPARCKIDRYKDKGHRAGILAKTAVTCRSGLTGSPPTPSSGSRPGNPHFKDRYRPPLPAHPVFIDRYWGGRPAQPVFIDRYWPGRPGNPAHIDLYWGPRPAHPAHIDRYWGPRPAHPIYIDRYGVGLQPCLSDLASIGGTLAEAVSGGRTQMHVRAAK